MEFEIIAESKRGTETVDWAETLDEAMYLCGEYQMAFGPDFVVYYEQI